MKALKDKTQPILKEDVDAAIWYFHYVAGISTEHTRRIGSAGKVELSNDIDLAIDVNFYEAAQVHPQLIDTLGEKNCTFNTGTKVGSYAIDIGGKTVQVDAMYVTNLDWAEFIYYSPGDKSKYKGSVRAVLLSALAASIWDDGRDFFNYTNDGELIARAGWTIDPNVGMKRIFQIRPNKIHGSGYVKQMKNITPEELQELYPRQRFDHQPYVVNDPVRVTEMLLGWGTTPEHIDTTEKLIDLIKKRHKVAHYEYIFRIAQERAAQLDTLLPQELQKSL